MNKIIFIFHFLIVFFFIAACEDKTLGSSSYYTDDPYADYVDYSKEPTLKDTKGWVIDSLSTGLIHYNYTGFYQNQNSSQIINVMELDLYNTNYQLEFVYLAGSDSLSSVAEQNEAIAGINGTYELDASFVKTNGSVHSPVTLDPDHLRFWKHEGAIFFDGTNQIEIGYGTKESYAESSFLNILSGSPMLIDDFEPVGKTFIGDVSGINLNSLEGEDYRRHQGSRHPRTAVALTGGNKLLLMTVDGRWDDRAGGMTAEELTGFIAKYFDPKSALNIDGGGSTTMWIKGSESPNGVVNYPTDNGEFNHFGQRQVRTHILIREVSTEPDFDSGRGTQFDPYIIKTPKQLENMRNIDWSDAPNNPPYFRLEADIDMAGRLWSPINNTGEFERHLHFDGNGYVIKNLTVRDVTYASLFGVLCGSCKNLGVVNARVDATGGGIGIIAGYVGLKGPDKPTGIIENCYTSGMVKGSDAVGGIAGNVGKQNGTNYSIIRNCYSTAEVTALNSSGNSRAGGIAGIVYDQGVILNCFSTGKIVSSHFGAGGIIGWSDANLTGCVAFNESIRNTNSGKMGRISAMMGKVSEIAQGVNCWGLETIQLNNAGTILQEINLTTGVVTVEQGSYDGQSKSKAFLSDPANYKEIGWNMEGANPVWAPAMSSKGYPVLKWLYDRSDYSAIDGHN